MSSLLEICSAQAEAIFRKRGNFPSILFVAGGKTLEVGCYASKQEASDAEVLKALAKETGEDFKARGITEFAVAYYATKTNQLRNIETGAVMNMPRPGIMIEEHGKDETRAGFREFLTVQGSKKPILARMVSEPAVTNSPFNHVLMREIVE